jgi:hypothetical protein
MNVTNDNGNKGEKLALVLASCVAFPLFALAQEAPPPCEPPDGRPIVRPSDVFFDERPCFPFPGCRQDYSHLPLESRIAADIVLRGWIIQDRNAHPLEVFHWNLHPNPPNQRGVEDLGGNLALDLDFIRDTYLRPRPSDAAGAGLGQTARRRAHWEPGAPCRRCYGAWS